MKSAKHSYYLRIAKQTVSKSYPGHISMNQKNSKELRYYDRPAIIGSKLYKGYWEQRIN